VTSLAFDNLSAGYGKVRILRNVSLEIAEGECVTLLGKNGMGKSTLLKALLGIAHRHEGGVQVLDRDVTDWQTHRIVRLGVSYVAQEEPIFGDLTVAENLRLGGLRVRDYDAALARVVAIFPRLGERMKQKAGTLSGGERKMLMTGRALLPEPRLVLLDEVSEGLQPSLRQTLVDALTSYRQRTGAAIFLVEQNLDFALSAADRFAVLTGGQIVEQGQVGDAGAVAQIERHLTL
jgi:ABC-type branched-subunit amino acid transport system ATPase component